MHRKIVTVVFCDVVGSTALGEQLDPEALQALLARYFERMQAIVESHGGTVEKFIGDAVMAVFGVPTVHEDDALRAVRAAAEMRDAFAELGIRGCIGVNTGEVVVGTVERLATGDAVNVAARLQHAADADTILLGAATHELVREAVEAVAVEPLELKGKSEPVPAYRLDAVLAAPERAHDAPFVGREAEVASIRAAWERASLEGRCELVTVIGDAGLGKSRLVAEALEGLDARITRGRCLPYGDGITYWPVVEVVKQLGARPEIADAAESIRSLLGESERVAGAEQIAWAFRKLLEQEAPLVVVFDDIQWADETFLDLVEGVALLSAGAPILLLCMARPELLARRPEWPAAIRLEPLPAEAVEQLMTDLPQATRARVASAAGGNPLFVTEMVAMAQGNGEVEVPPTLRALLGARIDQLDPHERAVLERGSVEGEIFHRRAVQALATPDVPVSPNLAALVRRQLIRPDRAQLAGDDGFRFRHLLVRDTTYDSLPKSTRAELHERFADWLADHGAELVELDEIVGYHLEQAARFRAELGQPDDELRGRAADRLAAAGRRILRHGYDRTARTLLERAVELRRPLTPDIRLELDYAEQLHWADAAGAAGVAAEAQQRARSYGDALGEALARVAEKHFQVFSEQEPDVDGLELVALSTLPLVEAANDHAGLIVVWKALGYGVANARDQMEGWAQASEHCIAHARAQGWPKGDAFGLPASLVWGPRPADAALRTLDGLADEFGDAAYDLKRAYLMAALGRSDEAWAMAIPAGELLREFGDSRWLEWTFHIAVLDGDHQRAVAAGQQAIDEATERGLVAFQSHYAALLSRVLCKLERFQEAAATLELVRDAESEDWLSAAGRARVMAHHGEHAAAERVARGAVERGEQTDMLTYQGDGLWDLAEVLTAAGKRSEAIGAFEQALDRYEQKRNLAMANQLRQRLQSLRAAPPGDSPAQ